MVLSSERASDFVCVAPRRICWAWLAVVCARAKPSPRTAVALGYVSTQHKDVETHTFCPVFSGCGVP